MNGSETQAVGHMETAIGRRTILLAEDDDVLRNALRIWLEKAGYPVLPAGDGRAGWRLFLEHRAAIALVLTDVEMPGIDGPQLADRVRHLESGLPVLFMSGKRLKAELGQGFLAKPFQRQELLMRVGEVIAAAGVNA
jgi:DNA-binding response OmpR family regulator